jgi:hypothetical protein
MSGELARFDGSVLVDRTAGEMGARCDMEAMNILTLNLAHDIITGRRSVEEARAFYAETAAACAMGREAPYAEALLFEPPAVSDAVDPDEKMIGPSMADRWLRSSRTWVGLVTRPSHRADLDVSIGFEVDHAPSRPEGDGEIRALWASLQPESWS